MDIVGTVSAAISFVNFIVKAVYTGKEVADSGQAVKEHEDLDALAVTVGQGSANLQQKLEQNGGHALSPEEASLLTVLRQCTELHTSIRKLREKGEVQKPLSAQGRSLANRGRDKLQYGLKVGVVAIRVILNRKEDGESLRAQFTACSVALNSVLLLFMRYDISLHV